MEGIMKKSQNLKTILVVEIVLVLCLCIGVAGIVIYASGSQDIPVSGNPPAELSTATAIIENIPVTEATITEAAATEVATTDAATAETSIVTPQPEVKGMALEKLPDKTTKFTDYDGGYEVTFPVGWLAARPGDNEFNSVLAKEGAKNTMLADQMNFDKSVYDPTLHRVFSYSLRPDIQKNVIFGFSKIFLYPKDDVPINNNTMGGFVRDLEASTNILPGFRVTSSHIDENRNGISVLVANGRFLRKDESGNLTPFYATALLFKPTPNSTVMLTSTIYQDFQDQISSDLISIQESFKLLEQ